jgi:hypothetical protein
MPQERWIYFIDFLDQRISLELRQKEKAHFYVQKG